MVVKKTPRPDKAILVHKGALGDFLQAWPTLHAMSRSWPGTNLFWAGRDEYRLWLGPLRIGPCSPAERKAVDSLHWADSLPPALEGTLVLWFGLRAPGPAVRDRRVVFLQGIHDEEISPRVAYARSGRPLGIEPFEETACRADFRQWFGSSGNTAPKGEILLFPGAGHPMKCWPAVQFFQLFRWIEAQGLKARFVLGPAERERGPDTAGLPSVRPENLSQLQDVIARAAFVVGNDSGPMHLAGMLGIPGLVLFGPTSTRRWQPPGLSTITGKCPLRPCSAIARIDCTDNRCMRSIEQARVRKRLRQLLEKEDGLLRTVRNKPSSAKIGR